jgi:UPF0755 protein
MIKKIAPLLLTFFFLLLLVLAGLFFYTKHYLQTMIHTPSVLYIPKGSTKSIVAYFKSEGIDLHWLDYYLIKMQGYPQAGWIELGSERLSREAFFEKVTHAKAALQKVTLIPGETNVIFLDSIAKNLDLNVSKLQAYYQEVAPYADGVIFAETYRVARGIDEKSLIDYLVKESLKAHKKLAIKELGVYHDKRWFEEVVTKASIIQKEAADSDEMPIVSAVISNRLKKNMKLQMDGTLNYGKYSHVRVSAKKIKEDNSKFNTYKHLGLPPSPICAVSKDAIDAALHPAKVDYLYFVKGKNGKHIFTKSYKEHLKNIK